MRLPGIGGGLESLQLPDDFEHASFSNNLRAWGDVLPAQQPAHELSSSDRLNLLAQRAEREPVNARQQPAITPFNWGRAGKLSSQHSAFAFEAKHGSLDIPSRQSHDAGQPGNLDRSGVSYPTSNELKQGIVSSKNRLADFGGLRLEPCPREEN